MRGRLHTKNNPRDYRITGLDEILSGDYAIEEPYWGPSSRPVGIMLVKFWKLKLPIRIPNYC